MLRLLFENLKVRYLTWRLRERLLSEQMRDIYKRARQRDEHQRHIHG